MNDDSLLDSLRAADPAAGLDIDAAHLAGLAARAAAGPRAARRGRRLRPLAGLAGAAVAVVLAASWLARPSGTALAWSPAPSSPTPAQVAAAEQACRVVGGPVGAVGAPAPAASAPGQPGGGAFRVVVGGSGVVDMGAVPAPAITAFELHGGAGVAVLTDGTAASFCVLRVTADGLALDRQVETMVSWGSVNARVSGASEAGVLAAGEGLRVYGLDTTAAAEEIGILAGTADAGIASVRVEGGPADGATAAVSGGWFALWSPGGLGTVPFSVTGLDGAGAVVATLSVQGQ